jgi:hypothetical protein
MSKFTFICEEEPCPFGESITTKRTVEFSADHLGGVIGEFETFLKGCGFQFDGHLEIYEPEESSFEKDDLDDLDSIFNNKKSLIRSDGC